MQYDRFAPYYDTFAQENSAGFIRRVSSSLYPQARTLLDIACGTGNDILDLSEFYKCTGLDISSKMINIARKKIDAQFLVKDMKDFDLKNKFDIIICMFDSINHLSSIEDIEKTFSCVSKHMHKNSIFIFDVNTYAYLDSLGEGYDFYIDNGIHISLIPKRTKAIWEIRKDNKFLEAIEEYFFTLEELKKVANRFFRPTLTEYEGKPVDETTHRAYFICQNP